MRWCVSYNHKIMNSKEHFHKFHSNTHASFSQKPSSLPPCLSLLLPPLQCKRPWCLFEGLPRHISTANLACYTRATIAKSSSLIVMTHKARLKHKCVPSIEPLLDERNRVFISEEEKERIRTDWPPLPPESEPVFMIKPWASVSNSDLLAHIWGKECPTDCEKLIGVVCSSLITFLSFVSSWTIPVLNRALLNHETLRESCQFTKKLNVTCNIHQLPCKGNLQPRSVLPCIAPRWREFTSTSHKINDHLSSWYKKRRNSCLQWSNRVANQSLRHAIFHPLIKKKHHTLSHIQTHTHTHWLWTSASQLKQHLIWGDENGGTRACNPVRVTPARLKWVPVAVENWLGATVKWICLQSHSQMNTAS